MSFKLARPARGVTIIELIIFMVIMGVAAACVIGVINLSANASADPLRRKQALMIAEALLEEVQLARFTFCNPADAVAATAAAQGLCTTPVQVATRAAGVTRPYGNVAEYATAINADQSTFAVGGVDRDISGLAFGVDSSGGTMGNASLAPIRSTVRLNYVSAQDPLGPASAAITSSASALDVLQITIITTYGNGANDFVRLDGYRTRYAPNFLP
jgi:MSHA pilin protein MshD